MPHGGGPDPADRALLARFAAYLYASGATLVLATLLAPHTAHAYFPGIVTPAIVAYGVAALLAYRGERLPIWCFRAVPVAGSLLITVVAYSGHEAAPAYALLYLWAALYAFYFLPRSDAVVQVIQVVTLYTVVLVTAGPFPTPQVDWLMTLGTVLVAVAWVRSVVRRLRDHAAVLDRTGEQLRSSEAHLRTVVEELEQSNRELEQFARVSAHDLQEPLRMVASYVELLARRYRGRLDSDADEFIGYAVEGATRMQMLITDLIDFSGVGRGPRDLPTVRVRDCVDAATHNLTASIEATGGNVLCAELPTVRADPGQLALVFQNLVGNGIKFHGADPPRVEIGAVRERGSWVFSVHDNGIGVEHHQCQRIFLIFQRLNSRERFDGTGIGLAICKKIVERHGGRIWVDSALGRGSTFYFTIPAELSV